MNIRTLLWDAARVGKKRALPILSFPAAQKLGVSVETLVKSAELQAQAMETIARETETIAAVSLMDLSVEAEAFGAQVRFSPDEVPAIVGQLVSDEDEANDLEVPDLAAGRALLCVEAVRTAKARITGKPVLAGMIGPYSLAGRLLDVSEAMILCYAEPDLVHTVLRKCTDFLIEYIKAYKAIGANGVVMAEPLAGMLSPNLCAEFSAPYVKEIVDAVQDENFIVVYHNCGNNINLMTESIFSCGAKAYHFGNAVELTEMIPHTPANALVMGNVDPAGQICNGTPESVREATLRVMENCSYAPNFCISSGCDIPPQSPWANIDAFFAAVEEFNAR